MENQDQLSPLKYHPRPKTEREGIALCLSGGGFRASLFHLGALRRLHELDLLDRLKTISSVSGGSIMSAHLAARLLERARETGSFASLDFERDIAAPFRSFAARDIRTGPVLKRFLLPWNWFRRSTQVRALEKKYRSHLTDLTLNRIPERPLFVFCATDIGCGVNWEFRRTRCGDYQLGYADSPDNWPLARAVAASSCFPPVFDPMQLKLAADAMNDGKLLKEIEEMAAAEEEITDPAKKQAAIKKRVEAIEQRKALIETLRLSDGGVYDNLGLEPVWKDHAAVLVSDGGAPFRAEPATTVIRQLSRYVGIAGNQAAALRKRWLISNLETDVIEGTYWGIGSSVSRYPSAQTEGYSKDLAANLISRIRTDLDGFSDAEMKVLENHGYTLAATALRVHTPSLLPPTPPPASIPHPEWMDIDRVKEALADSHKRIRW